MEFSPNSPDYTDATYNVPVFRSLRPWVKFDVFNLFDNRKLIAWNVTIRPDPATPVDSLGLRTGFLPKAAGTYGTATGNTIGLTGMTINTYPSAFNQALPGGRTARVAVGFRF